MNKKIILIPGSVLLLAGLLIVADYFTLFGTSSKQELDFATIKFKTSDVETGAPIFDAHATCYRHGNHDACTERESNKKDTVAVYFAMYKTTHRSFLFSQGEEIDMPLEGSIKIMLIHNDYHNVKNDYELKDIYLNSGQTVRIEMKPRVWANEAEESG